MSDGRESGDQVIRVSDYPLPTGRQGHPDHPK